jgi:O-antigen ligase
MEYFIIGIYFLVSFGLAISVVLVLGAAQSYSRRSNGSIIQIVIYAIGIGIVVSNLSSGRNLSLVGESIDELYASSGSALYGYFQKVANIGIFALALGACFERVWNQAPVREEIPKRRTWLMVLLVFSITNGMLSAAFGTHPKLVPGLLYTVPVLCLLALDGRWNRHDLAAALRNACLFVLIAGYVALAVKPSLVMESHFHGALVFLPFRFYGATPHANALGGLAVLSMLLVSFVPFESGWKTTSMWIIAFATMVLAQSKTAYIAFALAFTVVHVYRTLELLRGLKDIRKIPVLYALGIIAAFIFVIAIVGFLLIGPDISDAISRQGRDGASVLTLSGRTKIWDAAFAEWRLNPLFGYGPDLFDLEHRARLGMLYAFHAHNQFVQTLAQSGLVGIVGLLALLSACVVASIKMAAPTRGISLGILALILARCLTEVPLRSGALMSAEFLTLLSWLILIVPTAQPDAVLDDVSHARSNKSDVDRRIRMQTKVGEAISPVRG